MVPIARLTVVTRSKDINSAQRTVGCRMIIDPPAQKLYTTNNVPGGELSALLVFQGLHEAATDCSLSRTQRRYQGGAENYRNHQRHK